MTAAPRALWVSEGILLWIKWTLKYFTGLQEKLSSGNVVLSFLLEVVALPVLAEVGYGLLV